MTPDDSTTPQPDLLDRGFRYALSLTHHEARAADLLQEACLAVVKAGGSWTRAYLFTAIRSRHLNQRARDRLVVLEPVADAEVPTEDDVFGGLTDDPLEALEDEALAQGLGSLPAAQREALFLAAVEDYTAQEIADLTDRPRGTVLSLIHRARHKLRALLSPSERKAQ